jgi:hypothetical protein
VVVESPSLTATVLPDRGGRISSLRTGSGVELLAQNAALSPVPPRWGSFTDADMCGWDECIPTVDACRLPDGAALPDHGEAWSCDWHPHGDGWWGFTSRTLPYAFSRRIAPSRDGLHLEYRATATQAYPVAFLWAAHPQFDAPSGTWVELRGEVETVVDALTGTEETLAWDDRTAGLVGLPSGGCRKVYLRPDECVPGAALVRPDGLRLTMSWDPELVPYLGLWFDNGAYARGPVIAIEPSTGWYDRADRAVENGRVSMVSPGVPYDWWISLEVNG